VRKLKGLMLMVFLAVLVLLPSGASAAETTTTVDLTAKIEGTNFWNSYYSTSAGEEETVTLYRLKSVTVDIKSGGKTLEAFTFTPMGPQSYKFAFTTDKQNITVQYRATTYAGREFVFGFAYKPGSTLSISSNNSPLIVKTPFLNYK